MIYLVYFGYETAQQGEVVACFDSLEKAKMYIDNQHNDDLYMDYWIEDIELL